MKFEYFLKVCERLTVQNVSIQMNVTLGLFLNYVNKWRMRYKEDTEN